MTIPQIEAMDGLEGDRWAHHFKTRPFLIDFIDMAQAHICQAVIQAMGGKAVALEKFLLIKRGKSSKKPKKGEKTFFAEIES